MNFKTSNNGPSNPHFIKLKDGEFIEGTLRGDPHTYEKAFKPGDDPKFRFQVNMVVKENGALVAKILEGGWKLFRSLEALQNAGWKLETSKIRISRSGSKMNDTVYSVAPSAGQPNPNEMALIEKVELRPLGEKPSGQPFPSSPNFNADDCPF